MKNKWLLLAMVFVFGLIGFPVFAFAPSGDGVFIGKATEAPPVSATLSPQALQLETVMGTLLATLLLTVIFRPILKYQTGPASNVPERYDKARVSWMKRTKSPVLKSHSA